MVKKELRGKAAQPVGRRTSGDPKLSQWLSGSLRFENREPLLQRNIRYFA
jgi:hypothetical protein